jgi:hypothetical protein
MTASLENGWFPGENLFPDNFQFPEGDRFPGEVSREAL